MKRSTVVVMVVLAYLLGVASSYIIPNAIGWALFGSNSGQEMSRKTSPDGVLDAVVIENDPGAMSSFIYYLYLVPKGEKVFPQRPIHSQYVRGRRIENQLAETPLS